MKGVILSGGIFHPFAETSAALADLLAAEGIVCTVTEDVAEAIDALAHVDLFAVNALRWTMTQHEKYAPHRARWAMELTAGQQAAIDGFVQRGRGLLALHTATICFDAWPGWRVLLGGGWQWGASHHPPPEPADVAVLPGHAITRGLTDFCLTDEIYHALSPGPDCNVLAQAASRTQPAGPQPLAWCRSHGAGRVFVDALGHDAASLAVPGHGALLRRAARWLTWQEPNEGETP